MIINVVPWEKAELVPLWCVFGLLSGSVFLGFVRTFSRTLMMWWRGTWTPAPCPGNPPVSQPHTSCLPASHILSLSLTHPVSQPHTSCLPASHILSPSITHPVSQPHTSCLPASHILSHSLTHPVSQPVISLLRLTLLLPLLDSSGSAS